MLKMREEQNQEVFADEGLRAVFSMVCNIILFHSWKKQQEY